MSKPEETLVMGEIRYRVFTGPDGKPWVCRMELVYISPKGRSGHFKALDTAEPYLEKLQHWHEWPDKTPKEAVYSYQYDRVRFNPFLGSGDNRKAFLAEIIAAELLYPKQSFFQTFLEFC